MATEKTSDPSDFSLSTTPIPLREEVLQMAREAKRDQGIHETEVSFCGEAGLHDSLDTCTKNPGHKEFTPITELGKDQLPPILHDDKCIAFLVSKARETVRLICSYTSPARPSGYCFSNFVGQAGMTRAGSGRIWSVYKDRVRKDIPCPFSDCEYGVSDEDSERRGDERVGKDHGMEVGSTDDNCLRKESDIREETGNLDMNRDVGEGHCSTERQGLTNDQGAHPASGENPVPASPETDERAIERTAPHYVTGYFRVHTAMHVVFDDAEARETIVEFFYDDHRDTRHVIKARGVRVARCDIDGDYCVMDCVSHDLRLGDILDAVRLEWSSLWPDVKDRLYGADVTLAVSHPHGCSKQFSVGKCLRREWGEAAGGQGWYRYVYSAATCPGSSGAPVWVPGRDGLISGYAPHSGSTAPGEGKSAVWFFWNQQGK